MKAISRPEISILSAHASLIFLFRGIIFILVIILAGCSKNPDLPGFDKTGWQQDVRSCRNIRPGLVASLKKNTRYLVGLRHNEVIAVLGKPEGNSLEKSGERVYYYYTEPGSQCDNKNKPSEANKVFIRFDALDRAYKIKFDDRL